MATAGGSSGPQQTLLGDVTIRGGSRRSIRLSREPDDSFPGARSRRRDGLVARSPFAVGGRKNSPIGSTWDRDREYGRTCSQVCHNACSARPVNPAKGSPTLAFAVPTGCGVCAKWTMEYPALSDQLNVWSDNRSTMFTDQALS